MFDFKADLTNYYGQKGETPVGASTGGATQGLPSFQDDIQNYSEMDSNPITAKKVEYNKKIANTQAKMEAEAAQGDGKPYDPTGKTPEQIMAETGRQSELDGLRKANGAQSSESGKTISQKMAETGRQAELDALKQAGRDPDAEERARVMAENARINAQVTQNAPKNNPIDESVIPEIDYGDPSIKTKEITQFKDGTVGGHCAVFAESLVKLPDGSNWVVGDYINQKKQAVERYRDAGLAFKPGEDVPRVGNAVIMDPGHDYGHAAVVNSVNPDGTLTLTESNLNWDKRVTNTRRVSMTDPSIVGFLRTQ
jgi:hypothetical protein